MLRKVGKVGREIYQCVNAEDVFAQGGEFERCDADFPALLAACDFGAQSAADDLVAEADTEDADARLRFQDFAGKFDELDDPWVVVEGVVF